MFFCGGCAVRSTFIDLAFLTLSRRGYAFESPRKRAQPRSLVRSQVTSKRRVARAMLAPDLREVAGESHPLTRKTYHRVAVYSTYASVDLVVVAESQAVRKDGRDNPVT